MSHAHARITLGKRKQPVTSAETYQSDERRVGRYRCRYAANSDMSRSGKLKMICHPDRVFFYRVSPVNLQ
jgi:hypothetical protein